MLINLLLELLLRVAVDSKICQKDPTRYPRLRVLDRWTPTASLHPINISTLGRRDPEATVLVHVHVIAVDFVGAQDRNPRFESRVRRFRDQRKRACERELSRGAG